MATQAQAYDQNYPGQPAAANTKGTPLKRVGHAVESFLMAQWANIIAIVLGVIVLCAIAVPFLFYLGLDNIARQIFFTLHYVCAQIPSHSFYLFGYQLGLCARNFSIYSSMFVGSLIFVLSKKRLPGIPWWMWVLLCLPMAWDGFTQMFGLRESTWELRVLTGVLFGLGSVWFVLPLMHKTLLETVNTPPIPVQPLQRMATQTTPVQNS